MPTPRVEVTCSVCRWTFKGSPISTVLASHGFAPRCRLCKQERAVRKIESRLQAARMRLTELRDARARAATRREPL